MTDPKISLRGVSKSFPGVRALSQVDLDLYPGEVTALIGENGAGKSTLVKTLTGIYQPDEGEILIDGKMVQLPSPHAAFMLGITAIHQETVLFDDLSVAENIFLGHAPKTSWGLIDWRKMTTEANALLKKIGAGHINEKVQLKDISIANRHLVAVARALSIESEVVILDEPTAALSHKEINDLFDLIALLKTQNKAILFISHKFDEIFKIADRYTVFRDGEKIGDGLMADTDQKALVQMMVGRTIGKVFPKRKTEIGEPFLKVNGLTHPTEFADISFNLNRGEVLGFYGLVGAGRSEVMQALFGITRATSGTVELEGKSIDARSPADAIGAGIVYLPEERGKQGVVTDLPIFQNVSLPSLSRTSRNGFLQVAKELSMARHYADRLDLRAASLSQEVGTLSGGNQQKVVIAKWLATEPKVIILDEPTKGIDIGSKAAVHELIASLVEQGLSVIMVSSELPEVMGMSDRIIVMREGRIVGRYDNDAALSPEILIRTAADIDGIAA